MDGSAGDYASANFRPYRLAVLDPHPPRTWRRAGYPMEPMPTR